MKISTSAEAYFMEKAYKEDAKNHLRMGKDQKLNEALNSYYLCRLIYYPLQNVLKF